MREGLLRSAVGLALVGAALSGCLSVPGASFDFHKAFYSDATYKKLLIEVDYQDGMAPRAAATDLLKTRIGERLHKPGGVDVAQHLFDSNRETWSLEDMKELRKTQRTHQRSGDTMVLYVQYLDGRFSGNQNALGVQWDRDSFSIFKDAIEQAANPANRIIPLPFTAADVERAVIVHEFGHILGLVNHGIPMQTNHEDPEHPGHSTNKNSVMYYAVESLFLGQVFNGPPPTQFDEHDIADMRAAGGK